MKKKILPRLMLEMAKENILYESDVAMSWLYSALATISEKDWFALYEEITGTLDFRGRFFWGNFYHFDYIPLENSGGGYESYDRKPLILMLRREGKTIHGLNLNYLGKIEKIRFINTLFRFIRGDIDRGEMSSRIILNYEMMKSKAGIVEQQVIYRKYLVERMREVKIIPTKYLKIFTIMEPSLFRGVGYSQIHKITKKKIAEKRLEERKKTQRRIG
jgi:hypothetical protein